MKDRNNRARRQPMPQTKLHWAFCSQEIQRGGGGGLHITYSRALRLGWENSTSESGINRADCFQTPVKTRRICRQLQQGVLFFWILLSHFRKAGSSNQVCVLAFKFVFWPLAHLPLENTFSLVPRTRQGFPVLLWQLSRFLFSTALATVMNFYFILASFSQDTIWVAFKHSPLFLMSSQLSQ